LAIGKKEKIDETERKSGKAGENENPNASAASIGGMQGTLFGLIKSTI